MTQRSQEQKPRGVAKGSRRAEKDHHDSDEQHGSTGRNHGRGDYHDGANTGKDYDAITGGSNRSAPEPEHLTESSGTSDFGRSACGEPSDHEHKKNEGLDGVDQEELKGHQSQSGPPSTPIVPTRPPLNHR